MSEEVHSSVRAWLQQETAALHADLEARLDLLDPSLGPARYRRVLQAFYGYYQPVEGGLEPLAARLGCPLPLRARAPLLARDLATLGLSDHELEALPRCARLPPMARREHLAGVLYVLEGACLGGRVIARHVVRHLGLTPDRGAAFFTGDEVGVGMRWRSVLQWLEDAGQSGGLASETARAARETFQTLRDWCALQGALR